MATAFASASGLLSRLGAANLPTPPEIEGPFYPLEKPKDEDFDLTRIQGHKKAAKGAVIELSGRVIDTSGAPIEDAMVELWQANAAGRYAHPRDRSKNPLDPNFQGWAIVPSGKKGNFAFKTIKPGTYQAAKDWTRPPHIHFKVSKFGFKTLTTQMYFPGEKLNEIDGLLQRKKPREQALMIAKADPKNPAKLTYDIVLASTDEKAPPPQQD